MKALARMIVVSMAVLIYGCGGGGGGGGSSGNVSDYNGIWFGTFSSEATGLSYSTGILIFNGDVRMASRQGGIIASGSIDGSGNLSLKLYQISGSLYGSASGSLKLSGSALNGSYKSSTGDSGNINLTSDSSYTRLPDIQNISGTWKYQDATSGYWLSITIDSTWNIASGTSSDGCSYSGEIAPSDGVHNIYDVWVNESCAQTTMFGGYAFLTDIDATNDGLVFIINDSTTYGFIEFKKQ